MKTIKNAYWNADDKRLIVCLEQEIEGEKWSRNIEISGDTAKNLWDSWNQGNEPEIINLILSV